MFAFYLGAAGTLITIVAFLMNIFYQVFSVAANIWLSVWSSDTTSGEEGNQKQYEYLGIYAALGLGLGIDHKKCFLLV